jgi:hypothetical protein
VGAGARGYPVVMSEHPPARSARPEIDPRDPPDTLRPDDGDERREEDVRDDRAPEPPPPPQPSPGS